MNADPDTPLNKKPDKKPDKKPNSKNYIVFGGGCYGTFYVGQLLKGHRRGKLNVGHILVIDHDPNCQVSTEFPEHDLISQHTGDWLAFGDRLLNDTALYHAHWVPAPLAPHVIYQWLRDGLGATDVPIAAGEDVRTAPGEENARDEPVSDRGETSPNGQFDSAKATPALVVPLPDLPFAQVIREGTLALSHAPGMCPVHCIEPRKCPLTGDDRHWEMQRTVQALAGQAQQPIDAVETFICKHHGYGVGTIPVRHIQDAWQRLQERSANQNGGLIAVGTLSACHGVIDVMRLPCR